MKLVYVEKESKRPDVVPLHCVNYGSVVTLPEHEVYDKDYLYIKIDKNRVKRSVDCVSFECPRDHCLLFNPKYGRVRSVPAQTKVRIKGASMNYWDLDTEEEVSQSLKKFS